MILKDICEFRPPSGDVKYRPTLVCPENLKKQLWVRLIFENDTPYISDMQKCIIALWDITSIVSALFVPVRSCSHVVRSCIL